MKLLQFLEAIQEKFDKAVVWDNGQFFIAVNNPDKPTFFTAWTQDNEKVATLSTKVMPKNGEQWMAVDYVEVDPKSQRQGIARALYHVMIDGMSPEYAGLFGYGPDIASQHVSKIYQRYGAHEQEDGHFYIPNPNRGVTETEGDTLKLPDIDVGDELMVGKFKNRRATVKGFTKDKHNQPIAKTNKGDQQIFKGRVKKLMDEAVDLGELEDDRMAMYYVSVAGDEVKKAMEKEPEYIHPFLDEFTGDYQLGLEDLDDERRAEFEAWLETAIYDQAHEAYTRVVQGIKTDNEHGGILLYRYIVAPPNLPKTFHTQPVGIYWSSNPNDAKAHNSTEKEGWIEWLITAVTSPHSINWVATIFQNTIEPHEAEIQVTQGEPVTIINLKPQTSPESADGPEGMPGQSGVRYDFWDNREEPLQLTASVGNVNESQSFDRTTTDMEPYDALINAAGNERMTDYFRQQKGKEWRMVDISPDEYLDAVDRSFEHGVMDGIEDEKVQLYIRKLKAGETFPALTLDYSRGNHLSQEGRHRSLAAKAIGIKSVPVLIVTATPEEAKHWGITDPNPEILKTMKSRPS